MSGPPGPLSLRVQPLAFILACVALGLLSYAVLERALPLTPAGKVAHELAVFISFLVLPLALLVLSGRRPELGGLDRGFLAGVGLYLLILLPLLALIPGNRDYFASYRMDIGAAALWAGATLVQVSSVDFFTKRIVQLEAERLWGSTAGLGAQFCAWAGAHVLEYGWLKDLAGPAGAFAFLGVTGALTGLVYQRTKNVWGMMAGHWVLNLLLAAAALAYLGPARP